MNSFLALAAAFASCSILSTASASAIAFSSGSVAVLTHSVLASRTHFPKRETVGATASRTKSLRK
eukprot:9487142-Pyramimonas_sp.AAC.1